MILMKYNNLVTYRYYNDAINRGPNHKLWGGARTAMPRHSGGLDISKKIDKSTGFIPSCCQSSFSHDLADIAWIVSQCNVAAQSAQSQ